MLLELLSYLVAAIAGGGLLQLITMGQQRKKATAEADGAKALSESTELDNVEKAIRIWREMAENLKAQRDDALSGYAEMARKVEDLRKDVQKLNCTNQRILKLLDKISHDNLEKTVEEMKEVISKG